jgi:hypothetical protein
MSAAMPDMKGNHLACFRVHGNPAPLLVGLLLDKAGHCIGFHLQPLYHHILRTGDGLDMEMIRQCFEALDEKTQEPLECHPHGTTNAAQRNPFEQQAFDQRTPVSHDAVLLVALDELPATVVAVMILLPVVNMTVFLLDGITIPLYWQ